MEDRRKHERHAVKEGTYAILKPYYDIMGPVVDISDGGLAFKYHPLEDAPPVKDKKNDDNVELSIMSVSGDFFLDGIHIHIVSDTADSESRQTNILETKRCSLKFDEQKKELQEQLNELILNMQTDN